MTTIRSIIAVAVKKGWSMFQLDINNSFLHGKLDEEMYIRIPKGWGYTVSKNDYSLFLKCSSTLIIIVVVHPDDILLSGNDEGEISSLKLFLDNQFRIKGLGHWYYFLGLENFIEAAGVIMCQRKFAMDVLTDLNVWSGLLLPDLALSIHHLSQFIHASTVSHMAATFHVLKYVKGALSQGLFMSADFDFTLQAYCDSDWDACANSRKSVSGYLVMLGSSLLVWKSKKHHT
uniref:Uncharacterized mitochondrial protein AtMg00810-like n=1 Tax=Nicotiana tabacum TaxID=4097 RepID=A0A1S3YGH2_TOBAC|nr:PREDICTED: uncharacterized mitochondrial protein AtMg00810-like [Nicotiana tabacum]